MAYVRLPGFLAVGAAAVVAYFWTPDTWVQTVCYDTIGFAGVFAMAVGLRRHRPAGAAPWWLLLLGVACYVGGDMVSAVLRRGFGLEPFPSPADYVYLTGYVLQAAGLWLLVRRRTRERGTAAVLEASIIATAFALVAWMFLMRPVVVDPDYGLHEKAFLLGYPALDLLLLSLLSCLLAGAGPRNVAFRWLTAGVVLTLGADFAWAFTDVTSYQAGTVVSHLIDSTFLLSYLSWGAATLHPSVHDVGTPASTSSDERLGTLRLALLAAATLIAPSLLLWQATRHPVNLSDAVPIAVGSAAMFLLVIARMALLLRQVQAQSRLLAQQAVALEELAQQDPLTQLPNRRAWSVALPAALERSRRSHEPVAVAMVDLDFFKRYNDTYGHPAGDQLLKAAAAAWSSELRQVDLLARYGGEEFVLLLPGTTAADATALVERLRRHTPQKQTFSAGVTVWDGTETADDLVQRADQALYAAKSAGRDRVLYAPAEPVHPAVSVTEPADVAVLANPLR